MDSSLPIELLVKIAVTDASTYKYMLAIPEFARFALANKEYIEEILIEKVEYKNSTKYYLGNVLHRRDGPAMIGKDGRKEWYWYGKIHRLDGPAVEFNGVKTWYRWGKKHRDDGPAVISRKYCIWYRNGLKHRDIGPAYYNANGNKIWYQWDKKHRDYGPAVVHSNGNMGWYRRGKLHREDGPAIVSGGNKYYYKKGKEITMIERMLDFIGL